MHRPMAIVFLMILASGAAALAQIDRASITGTVTDPNGAVMRKLLHAIFGMFKHHQLYDGSKVFRLPAQADSTSTSGVAA